LGVFLVGTSLNVASGNGRTTTRPRYGSMSEWSFRLLMLVALAPMIGFAVAHPHREAIPALLLISSAGLQYLLMIHGWANAKEVVQAHIRVGTPSRVGPAVALGGRRLSVSR
jgi:hypothetical protein